MLLEVVGVMEEWMVAHGLGDWSGPYGQFELDFRWGVTLLVAAMALGFVWLAPTGGLR